MQTMTDKAKREFTARSIGIGLCELRFEHADTHCCFAVTKSPVLLNITGLVFCPFLYRRLGRTSGGMAVSAPYIGSGDQGRIQALADRLEREVLRICEGLALRYSLVVGRKRSRLILPCLADLKEMGCGDDVSSDLMAALRTCLRDERHVSSD